MSFIMHRTTKHIMMNNHKSIMCLRFIHQIANAPYTLKNIILDHIMLYMLNVKIDMLRYVWDWCSPFFLFFWSLDDDKDLCPMRSVEVFIIVKWCQSFHYILFGGWRGYAVDWDTALWWIHKSNGNLLNIKHAGNMYVKRMRQGMGNFNDVLDIIYTHLVFVVKLLFA